MIRFAPPLLPLGRPNGLLVAAFAASGLLLAMTAPTLRRSPTAPTLVVQVTAADEAVRERQVMRATRLLGRRSDVVSVRPLGRTEIARLLGVEPTDLALAGVPVPALIDVTTQPGAAAAAIDRAVRGLDGVQVVREPAASPVEPMSRTGLPAALSALLAVAVLLLASVSTFARQRPRATLARDLGARDAQIVDLIARPLLRDLALGIVAAMLLTAVVTSGGTAWLLPLPLGLIGAAASMATIYLLVRRLP